MSKYIWTLLYIALCGISSVAYAATLRLETNKATVSGTDAATITIILDTEDEQVQAVDTVVTYNSSIFSIIDENSGETGTQIKNGSIFPILITNSVNGGVIRLSHGLNPSTSFTGEASIASFRVIGLRNGTGNFSISYTQGSTTDSNIASGGSDILSSVGDVALNSAISSGGSGSGSGSGSGGGSGSSSGSGSTPASPVSSPSSGTGVISPQTLKGINVPLTVSLYKGLKSSQVTILQRMLIAEGHLAAGNDTGFFGSLTEIAVQSFQRSRGIVSSGSPLTTGYGVVGPQTRSYINARISGQTAISTPPSQQGSGTVATPSTPQSGYYTIGNVRRRTLSLGSEGFDVKALQRFLNLQKVYVATSGAGSLGRETEYFGPATHAAVVRFQNLYRTRVLTPSGLSAGTGIVGPATWTMIENLRK